MINNNKNNQKKIAPESQIVTLLSLVFPDSCRHKDVLKQAYLCIMGIESEFPPLTDIRSSIHYLEKLSLEDGSKDKYIQSILRVFMFHNESSGLQIGLAS